MMDRLADLSDGEYIYHHQGPYDAVSPDINSSGLSPPDALTCEDEDLIAATLIPLISEVATNSDDMDNIACYHARTNSREPQGSDALRPTWAWWVSKTMDDPHVFRPDLVAALFLAFATR
jgi:hypothetical protein